MIGDMKGLDEAHTVDEVLDAVNEFIAARSDVYWMGVPEDLRAPAIASADDLNRWHHGLIQAIARIVSPGTPMQELCIFSLRASVRVHQILLKEDTRPSSNDREFSARAGPRRAI